MAASRDDSGSNGSNMQNNNLAFKENGMVMTPVQTPVPTPVPSFCRVNRTRKVTPMRNPENGRCFLPAAHAAYPNNGVANTYGIPAQVNTNNMLRPHAPTANISWRMANNSDGANSLRQNYMSATQTLRDSFRFPLPQLMTYPRIEPSLIFAKRQMPANYFPRGAPPPLLPLSKVRPEQLSRLQNKMMMIPPAQKSIVSIAQETNSLNEDDEITVIEERINNTKNLNEGENTAPPPPPPQEKLSTEVIGEEKLSTEVVAEEKLSTEVVAEEKLSTEMVAEEKLSTEIVAEERLPTELMAEERLSTEIMAEKEVPLETREISNEEVDTKEMIQTLSMIENEQIVDEGRKVGRPKRSRRLPHDDVPPKKSRKSNGSGKKPCLSVVKSTKQVIADVKLRLVRTRRRIYLNRLLFKKETSPPMFMANGLKTRNEDETPIILKPFTRKVDYETVRKKILPPKKKKGKKVDKPPPAASAAAACFEESPLVFCGVCKLPFPDLDEHKKMACKKADVFICPYEICGSSFLLPQKLLDHMSRHGLEAAVAEFKCALCGDLFSRVNHLKGHIVNVHKVVKESEFFNQEEKSFCKENVRKWINNLAVSLKQHVDCKLCCDIFSSVGQFKNHLIEFHKTADFDLTHLEDESEKVSENERAICYSVPIYDEPIDSPTIIGNVCPVQIVHPDAAFQTEAPSHWQIKRWLNYLGECKDGDNIVCLLCGKWYFSSFAVSRHLIQHHKAALLEIFGQDFQLQLDEFERSVPTCQLLAQFNSQMSDVDRMSVKVRFLLTHFMDENTRACLNFDNVSTNSLLITLLDAMKCSYCYFDGNDDDPTVNYDSFFRNIRTFLIACVAPQVRDRIGFDTEELESVIDNLLEFIGVV